MAGGSNAGFMLGMLSHVELIDLKISCKLDPLPISLSHLNGINGIVCGGWSYTSPEASYTYNSKCWIINPNGTWTDFNRMSTGKSDFTMNIVGDEIFSIGGETLYSGTYGTAIVEKVSAKVRGNWSKLKDAPIKIKRHCAVNVNSYEIFVIGGTQNQNLPYYLKNTQVRNDM